MCRCRHWRLLLLDAFYHSIGSNILDVHVLLCSTSRHKSVPSTLENCHTYTYALKDHSRKARENWSRLKNMTEVSSPSEYNSKESNNAGASLFNWISKERKYCFESGKSLQSLGGPCRQALLCMMDVRIKNRRDFFLYPSSIRGVIISKLPFDIWPRRRWIFRLGSSASSGINYSADLDV